MSQVLRVAGELYAKRTGRTDFAAQRLREVVPFIIDAEQQIVAHLNRTLDDLDLEEAKPSTPKSTRRSGDTGADHRLRHGRSPRSIRRSPRS